MKRLILFGLAFSFPAFASQQLEFSRFSDINAQIRDVGARFGNSNVLTVFDIDDTTLVLNQQIGSEAWFEWQSNDVQCESACTPQMKVAPGANAVASDIGDLLAKFAKILYFTHVHPTEPEIPADINGLQKDGIRAIVLTSRGGFANRDSTLRHFQEAGISFSRVGLKDGQEGLEYVPRVTEEEKQKFGLTSIRPVDYTRGIVLTDGQHKGVMLLAWLRETKFQPKAIVFVDNESKNTNRVFSVFRDSSIDITTIRYAHEDPARQAFWLSDHAQAISEWQAFAELFDVFK